MKALFSQVLKYRAIVFMRTVAAFLSVFLLISCAGNNPHITAQDYLQTKQIGLSGKDMLYHCYGYGCKNIVRLELPKENWRAIRKIMRKKSRTAEAERKKIARTIGAFEKRVGALAGTDGDIRGTFANLGNFQHDCVDESINTTIYLLILAQENLLHYHSVLPPQSRFPMVHSGGWPHQSAMIKEDKTEQIYAVDSWMHDNGADADIMTLETWKYGKIEITP